MSRIVCGRFETTQDADRALQALRAEGFQPAEIDSFYVAPPGQNNLTPVGGDMHSDAGARHAGGGAMLGAVVGLLIGLALGTVTSIHLGPPSIAFGAFLGALVGAFGGTMTRLHGARRYDGTPEHPVEHRAGGRMIAVNVDRGGVEDAAISALRRNNARELGRTEGQWRDGSWRDFDPRLPLAAV